MKVLIGYDGSEYAEAAINDLQRAGLPANGTEALVLTVTDVIAPPSSSDAVPGRQPAAAVVLRDVARLSVMVRDAVGRARATAEQAAARVGELFPGWAVRAEAVAAAPDSALVAKAGEWGADLVVVGSHGRSALGRVLLGSVSQRLIHHAPCSVRIGRCPAMGERPRERRVRLVLAFDGSVDSATAVSAVTARCWPLGSEVLVVSILNDLVLLNRVELDPPDNLLRRDGHTDPASEHRDALASVCDDLRRSGLAATCKLVEGDPRRAIQREAERIGADCIVLGAKGHSWLERLLLGSVSASVAAQARCSIEVVRAGLL